MSNPCLLSFLSKREALLVLALKSLLTSPFVPERRNLSLPRDSPGMRVKLVGSCIRPPEETGPLPVLLSTVPLALLTALGLTLADTGAR